MLPTDIDRPELGSITIRLPNVYNNVVVAPSPTAGQGLSPALKQLAQTASTLSQIQKNRVGLEIDTFLHYEYFEDYLKACDAWSFSFSEDSMSQSDIASITLGAKVEVSIDGQPQTSGYIDKFRTKVGAGGGTVVTIEGRSWNSPAVDSHIDPQTRFSPSMTMLDVAQAALDPFGMQVAATDNVANRNAITGGIFGTKVTKKGKPLKSYVTHQIKPYPQEGAWAFMCRVAQRFGLWPRAAADGSTVIFSVPDFTQSPIYRLQHKVDSTSQLNNVLESDVERDREQQPTIVFGFGFGGGGEWAKSSLRGAIVNPLIVPPPDSLETILKPYGSVKPITVDFPSLSSAIIDGPIPDPQARPLFLYDPEAHTQDQLNAFLRRELSLRMRKSLVAHYTILGHRIGGLPVAVDTMIDVDDDRSNLHINMWVLSRRFSKKPGGGTTTQLELARPGSIVFGED